MNIDEIFAEINAEDLDIQSPKEDSRTFFERARTMSDELDCDMIFNARDIAGLTGFCPFISIYDVIVQYVENTASLTTNNISNIEAFEKKYNTKVYSRNKKCVSCFQITNGNERYKIQSNIDGIIYNKEKKLLFETRVKKNYRYKLSKFDIVSALIHMNMTFTKECLFTYTYPNDHRITTFLIKKEAYSDLFKLVKNRFFSAAHLIKILKENSDLYHSLQKMSKKERDDYIHEQLGFV